MGIVMKRCKAFRVGLPGNEVSGRTAPAASATRFSTSGPVWRMAIGVGFRASPSYVRLAPRLST